MAKKPPKRRRKRPVKNMLGFFIAIGIAKPPAKEAPRAAN